MEISGELQNLGKSLGVPLVILAQNQQASGRRVKRQKFQRFVGGAI